MNKKLAAYLVVVHVVLAALVMKDHVPQRLAARAGLIEPADHPFIVRMRGMQTRLDPAIPAGSVLFLGDSNTQSMPVSAVAPNAVNLGISWQRSDQLLASMDGYRSMQRAAAVVVMIGTNDVSQGRVPLYREVLAKVPAGVPVVLASAPPMIGADMQAEAARAHDACASDARCTFVDAFAALASHAGTLRDDGVHLTPAGYAVLIPALRDGLAHLRQSRTSP